MLPTAASSTSSRSHLGTRRWSFRLGGGGRGAHSSLGGRCSQSRLATQSTGAAAEAASQHPRLRALAPVLLLLTGEAFRSGAVQAWHRRCSSMQHDTAAKRLCRQWQQWGEGSACGGHVLLLLLLHRPRLVWGFVQNRQPCTTEQLPPPQLNLPSARGGGEDAQGSSASAPAATGSSSDAATPTFPGGSGAIARHPQPDQPQMPLSVTWPRHASGVAKLKQGMAAAVGSSSTATATTSSATRRSNSRRCGGRLIVQCSLLLPARPAKRLLGCSVHWDRGGADFFSVSLRSKACRHDPRALHVKANGLALKNGRVQGDMGAPRHGARSMKCLFTLLSSTI